MKNNQPLVSIIIPVYNVEKYLRECLDSVVGQTYKNLEIIVVDDGSTDGSGKILREYAARDRRFKIVREKNSGLSAARNHGYTEATGELVMFLDGDDVFKPDLIETMAGAIIENDADLAWCGYETFDAESGKKLSAIFIPDMAEGEITVQDLSSNEKKKKLRFYQLSVAVSVWTKMFRKTFIDMHKMRFDETIRVAEDVDWFVRSLIYANKIAWVNRPLTRYRTNRAGSNMATLEKNYGDVFHATDKAFGYIKKAGLWPAVEKEFVNYALTGMVYDLGLLLTSDAFDDEYDKIVAFVRKNGLDAKPEGFWLDDAAKEFIKESNGRSADDYHIRKLAGELESWKKHAANLDARGDYWEGEAKEKERELEKIHQSLAYRVGHKVTAPVRAVGRVGRKNRS
jgi:glycosyltransferase involved in cell wall biosynthesis